MASKARKILIIVGSIVGAVVVVLVALSWYLGLFNRVELQRTTRGPYQIVCLAHTGPYHQVAEKIVEVRTMLDEKGIAKVAACGVYYDDPKSVPAAELRSKGGYIVEGEIAVEAPFEIEVIPEREVILGRMKAHPLVAPLKIYPKINEWMKQNNFEGAGPGMEIYREDGVVESEIPIQPESP